MGDLGRHLQYVLDLNWNWWIHWWHAVCHRCCCRFFAAWRPKKWRHTDTTKVFYSVQSKHVGFMQLDVLRFIDRDWTTSSHCCDFWGRSPHFVAVMLSILDGCSVNLKPWWVPNPDTLLSTYISHVASTSLPFVGWGHRKEVQSAQKIVRLHPASP